MRYRMRKWCVGLILLVSLWNGIVAQAEEETGATVNYTYVEVTGGVEITGYTGEEEEIVIPAALAGKKVVSIGEQAFKSNNGITKITIPSSVETIGAYAFAMCKSLHTVELVSGLREIGEDAFFGCTKLCNIEIPNTVESIGQAAFRNNAITTIVLPASVTELGMNAFAGCTKLEKVVVNASITDVSISAFNGCQKMERLVIAGKVQSLSPSSFSVCVGLSEVEFSDKVTNIDGSAFSGLPDDVVVYTTYGSYASQWAEEKGLEVGYVIEESNCRVKLLPGEAEDKKVVYAGGRDDNVVSVTIPDSVILNEEEYAVTMVGDGVFQYCIALEEVVLPRTVQSVSVGAFDGLASGEGITRVKLTIPETLYDVSSLGIENLTNLAALTIYVKAGSAAESYYKQFDNVQMATYGVVNNDSTEKEDEDANEVITSEEEKELEETPKVEEDTESKQEDAESNTPPVSADQKEKDERIETVQLGMIYEVGDLQYKVMSENEVTLVGVTNKNVKKLVVPKRVMIIDTLFTVTAIGKRAVKNSKKLTTVVIGSSVESIGDEAFMNCKRLKKITIGKNVKRLGKNVFYGDKKLVRIVFKGAKVKKIGSKALRKVPKKVRITAPKKAIKTYKKLLNAAK